MTLIQSRTRIHHLALGIEGMLEGRRVLRFNTDIGEIGEYTVERVPHMSVTTPVQNGLVEPELVIVMRFIDGDEPSSETETFSCKAIGLLLDDPKNFVVAPRVRDLGLLPKVSHNSRMAVISDFMGSNISMDDPIDFLEDTYDDHTWNETDTDDPSGITRNDEFRVDLGN